MGAHTEQEEHILTLCTENKHLKAAHQKPPKAPKGPGKPTDKFSGKWKWKTDGPSKGKPVEKEFEGDSITGALDTKFGPCTRQPAAPSSILKRRSWAPCQAKSQPQQRSSWLQKRPWLPWRQMIMRRIKPTQRMRHAIGGLNKGGGGGQ
jgi:hypothetical protein